MKKPDRFERLVTTECGTAYGCTYQQMIALLRAEHRAVVRLVDKARRFTHNTDRGMELNKNGAWVFIDDLLAALAERAT